MRFRLPIVGLAIFFAAGCSGTLPMTYTAQNAVRASGAAEVGVVKYLPAEQGKLRPNQIRNTAMGSIYIDSDVKDYFRRAFTAELEKTGVRITGDANRLNCNIDDFVADDIGYSVDWTLKIECFVVTRNAVQAAQEKIEVKKHSGKFGARDTFSGQVNSMIVEAYEKLMANRAFVTALQTGVEPAR